MHRHQIGIALLMGLFWFVIEFQRLNGAPLGASRIGYWLNLAVFIWIGFVCYRAREGLSSMLLGGEEDATRAEHWMARAYPWIGIGLGRAHLASGRNPCGPEALRPVERRSTIRHDGHPSGLRRFSTRWSVAWSGIWCLRCGARGLWPRLPTDQTKRSYIRIGRALVAAVVIIILARIWDIDFQNLASAGVGCSHCRPPLRGVLHSGYWLSGLGTGYAVAQPKNWPMK